MVIRTKTTDKDFKLYCKTCTFWLEKFGLYDWDIDFCHTDWDDGCASSCTYNAEAGHAWLNLNVDWLEGPVNDEELKKTALHEVLELLLARYRDIATKRFTTMEALTTENHVVIQRLIHVLMP